MVLIMYHEFVKEKRIQKMLQRFYLDSNSPSLLSTSVKQKRDELSLVFDPDKFLKCLGL